MCGYKNCNTFEEYFKIIFEVKYKTVSKLSVLLATYLLINKLLIL